MITKKHVGVKTDMKKLSKSKDVEQNVKKKEKKESIKSFLSHC